MTRLICPDCNKKDFGTFAPTEDHVLKHLHDVHGYDLKRRSIPNIRKRQDQAWERLLEKNDAALNKEQRTRDREWEAFVAAPAKLSVPQEKDIDHLHLQRAKIMAVEEDDYDVDADGDQDDDQRGQDQKASMQRFESATEDYGFSFRFKANCMTGELARMRTDIITRAKPGKVFGQYLHENHVSSDKATSGPLGDSTTSSPTITEERTRQVAEGARHREVESQEVEVVSGRLGNQDEGDDGLAEKILVAVRELVATPLEELDDME